MADVISAANEAEDVLNRVVNLALQLTKADRTAAFVRKKGPGIILRPAAAASAQGGSHDEWERFRHAPPIDVEADPALLALWDSAEGVLLDDAKASMLVPTDWASWDSKSLAFAPLRANGVTYGLLVVAFVNGAHSFTTWEGYILDGLASAGGATLQSAQLLRRLKRAAEIDRELFGSMSVILRGGSRDELIEDVRKRFRVLFHDAQVEITLFDLAEGRLGRTPSHVRPAEDLHTIKPSEFATFPRSVLKSLESGDKAARMVDLPSMPDWNPLLAGSKGTCAVVSLASAGVTWGCIRLSRDDSFSREELRLAELLADHAAIALEQSRLTESLRARLAVTEALSQVADYVMRTSDLRAAIRVLNKSVCAELGIRCRSAVFLAPELTNAWRVGLPTASERQLIVAWRKQEAPAVVREGSSLNVPIPVRGRILGLLRAESTGVRPVFGDEVLIAIARGLGGIAQRAMLRRRLETKDREVTVERERARIAWGSQQAVGDALFTIGAKLHDAILSLEDSSDSTPSTRDALAEIRAFTVAQLSDIRRTMYVLAELRYEELGFIPSLTAMVAAFESETGTLARLRVHDPIGPLEANAELNVYRLVYEALFVLEHYGRATGVFIDLSCSEDAVRLEIRDDGVGLQQREGPMWRSGVDFGIHHLRNEMLKTGGELEIVDAQPRGLKVVARVPRAPSSVIVSLLGPDSSEERQ